MGNMRRIVLLLIFVSVVASLFILPGCGEEEPPSEEQEPREIPLMTFGNSTGLECMVVTNEKEYARFISRARKREDEVSLVDFDRYIMLTAWGDVSSSGVSIIITHVVQTGTRVDVQVEVIRPRPDMADLPTITFKSYYVLVERDSFHPRGEGVSFDQHKSCLKEESWEATLAWFWR